MCFSDIEIKEFKMKNYRILESCGNCKSCLVEEGFDDPDRFYCNNKKDRPVVKMQINNFRIGSTDKQIEDYEKLCKWEEEHEVVQNGICYLYKKKLS